jgi:hypothetical protein
VNVLAHVAGVPVEELLVPLLASGATTLTVATRFTRRWLGRRRED